MKHKINLFLSLLVISSISFAQKNVEASDIMKDIKAGKQINYNNVTINGVLDFTFMDEAIKKMPAKKKKSWFNWGSTNSTNEVTKIITVSISFIDCTFKGDVLAYIPNEDTDFTFVANFEENTIFKNCKFKSKAMFKYSKFEKDTDFSGSYFNDDSTFKYAKFSKNSHFSNTIFNEVATFKYAKFNNNVSFYNAIFMDSAIFKYTNFYDGVSFKNATFKEDLNIKYMKVSGDFNITNMKVAYEIDSKYTKINGKNFNRTSVE